MAPYTMAAETREIRIYMAGDIDDAVVKCGEFCDRVGLCVTVTPTTYVYTDGREPGIIVGLINYPRYPSTADWLLRTAIQLANFLRDELQQKSYSVVAPTKTIWSTIDEAKMAVHPMRDV